MGLEDSASLTLCHPFEIVSKHCNDCNRGDECHRESSVGAEHDNLIHCDECYVAIKPPFLHLPKTNIAYQANDPDKSQIRRIPRADISATLEKIFGITKSTPRKPKIHRMVMATVCCGRLGGVLDIM